MSRTHISIGLDREIRERAKNRCAYCLSPQHLVMGKLQIEHIKPIAKGGDDDKDNLTLACSICNGHKSDKFEAVDPISGDIIPLFNPNTQDWFEHFYWSDDGLRIGGLTPVGRATVQALHLDRDEDAIEVRKYWVAVNWHPPKE